MRQLSVLSLFHLNLAFSSIEEEQRPDVIARCYWPLLRLPDAIQVATAIRVGAAALITHDKALAQVTGLRVLGPA